MIDGEQLQEVTEYESLGRLVTSGNDISKEIAQRITSGWRRYGEYSHFLKDPYLHEESNRRYSHLTSYDLWSRDMGSNKTSGE